MGFKFTPPKLVPRAVRKISALKTNIAKTNDKGKHALDKLNGFLDENSPQVVTFVHAMHQNQQNAITYAELREALINGYMTPETLKSWQEDYSAFVNEHLKPSWINAMKAHAADLEAQHPDFFFDPMQKTVQDWIRKNGARWVTNQSATSKEAIQAMLGYATTGKYTVDELARVIRPTIGLTKPQAQANMRYYTKIKEQLKANHPRMTDASIEKKAKEAAVKYAEKQQRHRAYTIAQTELAFAYNRGADEAVKQAQAQGYMGKTAKRWTTAVENVCPVCAALNGKEVEVGKDFNLPGAPLFPGAHEVPPAHPRCKCAVQYIELEPPKIAVTAQGNIGTNTAAQPQQNSAVQAPKIPDSVTVPAGMKNGGKANLGGTGEIYRYTDMSGKEWLFKPAQNKSGSKAEPFRAYSQEAAYKVQHIVDPDTSTKVGTGAIDGKFGAFQEKINTLTGGIDLKDWQNSGGSIDRDTLRQLQREHITDWLCANFDSHGGNFVIDSKGRLRGIDKEQSFKYIGEKDAAHMSYKYHPNSKYGETEPIYNTIFRRFAHADIDLNLQDTLVGIKRIEAISDSEYREIFREYAEALHGKGASAEKLLDDILKRKQLLREEYRTFYSELLTERTGKKVKFVWADEALKPNAQPLAGVLHSPASLKKLTISELKKIAKAQKIPYYNNMNKTQLVTAISDPMQAPAMSAQVKARLAANSAARASQPKSPPKPKDVIGADELFSDFAYVPKNDPRGVVVHSDESSVEGLGLNARHMTIDKREYYEISGKLTRSKYDELIAELKKHPNKSEMVFEKIDDVSKEFYTDSGMGFYKYTLQDGDVMIEAYDNTGNDVHHAWEGFIRIRVTDSGNSKNSARDVHDFLRRHGLKELTATPTKAAEEIMKKKRLIWQHAPNRVAEYEGLTGNALNAKIDSIMRQEGISQNRLKNMVFEKVADGYGTYVEKGIANEYKKHGLTYVWSGVPRGENVVAIVKNGGMASTNDRCKGGFFDPYAGASSFDDMESGGSDSVFTRIGVKNAHHKRSKVPVEYSDCFYGQNYRIKFKPEIMERTDWYAYDSDSYGTTNAGSMNKRYSAVEFIKKMTSGYESGNEIMFRHGIPVSDFEEIIAETAAGKQQLIQLFNNEGITAINGVPLARFIKVGSKI